MTDKTVNDNENKIYSFKTVLRNMIFEFMLVSYGSENLKEILWFFCKLELKCAI